jgi:hypothetical protein
MLTIADDAIGNPHSIVLGGFGVTGNVSLSPDLVFVPDVVGSSSPAQVVSLWNSGQGVLTLSSVSATGDFAQTNNCSATLAANAMCSISVKFVPTADGVRNGNLIVASDAPGSPHSVTLTGTGLASLPVPVITLLSHEIRPVGSPDLALIVDGSGFSSMSVVRWDGVDRPTTFVSPTRLTATILAADFAEVRTAFLSVFNPAPGGGESTRIAFAVYREVVLTTKDLVYDSVGARLYASVGATAPLRANTLTPIDPATGALGASIAIGSDPSALAISRESAHMYVGLNGIGQVRYFDPRSQTSGTPFTLGSHEFFGAHRAREIAIDPENPGTIAVSKTMGGGLFAGVAIFDNGVRRPVETGMPDFGASINELAYSGNSSTLYGFNSDNTEHGFRTMLVDNQGVVVTNVTNNLIQDFADIRFEAGRLYVSNGQVIDPVNRTEVGRFQMPTSGSPSPPRTAIVDLSMGRAFFIQPTASFMRIVAFDLNTFALVGTMKVPPPLGSPLFAGNLVRWGEDGLAYRSFSQVYMVRIPASWLPATLALAPNSSLQGRNQNVAVTGTSTGFVQGQTTADFGFGITVNSVTVADSTHATVNITVAPGAPAGARMAKLTTGEVTASTPFTVIGSAGPLTGWGPNASQASIPTGLFKSIAAGDAHSLALRNDGTVIGWGSNTHGQLNAPAGVFVAIAAGASHSLGIRADGTLAGWGNNADGQINVPAGTFKAIAAGSSHSLAIRSDGTLAGWGANNLGQTDVPAGTFLAIAAGAGHSLAIRTDGTLVGWGSNSLGQLDVPAGTFAAVAAGSLHSLALRTDGTLVGWGSNAFGQLDVPVGNFTTIAAAPNSSLAIRTDGTLVAWGDITQDNVPPAGTYRAIASGSAHGIAIKAISIARRDFNGDGTSDLLWRNTNGLVAAWLMNGLGILQAGGFGTIPSDWVVEGTGDLNGDGKSDIVWRHTDGTVAVWLMDGLVLLQGAAFGTISATWNIGGTGDLNGDGTSDIVWRNVDGTVGVWLMNGLAYQGVAFGTIPASWTISGIGDLNGDGTSDIVWRNVDGSVGVWLMNGTVYQGAAFGTIPGTWSIAGVGDLNGDAKSDIVWRNVDGTVAVWLMDGLVLAQGAALGLIPSDWSLAGMGDLNGDGKSDLVWRHVDGTVAAWLMNGTSISQAGGFGTITADWILQSSK